MNVNYLFLFTFDKWKSCLLLLLNSIEASALLFFIRSINLDLIPLKSIKIHNESQLSIEEFSVCVCVDEKQMQAKSNFHDVLKHNSFLVWL